MDNQLLALAFQDGRVRRARPGDGPTLGEIRLTAPAQALRPDGKAALLCNPEGRGQLPSVPWSAWRRLCWPSRR